MYNYVQGEQLRKVGGRTHIPMALELLEMEFHN